jgi:CubicO group peptidase (beta-lactamase class C family)
LRALLISFLVGAAGCSPRGAAIDAVIGTAGALAVEEGIAGMIIGVEQHGVRRVRAFGHARLSPEVPSRPDEPLEIGSITKQFTSALVLKLVDDGKLRLDATLGELLPSAPTEASPGQRPGSLQYPPAARDVTVAQLLSHTGGVPNYLDLPDAMSRYASARGPSDLLAMVHDLRLRFPPGRGWEYSNSGYLLLGEIVARAGGASWEQQLEARLARPLGLASTRSCDPPDGDPGRPMPYDFGSAPRPLVGGYYAAADGSLCSTADDLLTWARALDRGGVVSATSRARMITPVKNDYGFGLQIETREGHRVLSHNGQIHYFRTALERWPEDDLTIVVFQNTSGNRAVYTAMNIGALLVGGPDGLFFMRFGWVHRRALAGVLLAAILAFAWHATRRRAT